MLKALRSYNVQKVSYLLHMIDLDQCVYVYIYIEIDRDRSTRNYYAGGLPGSPHVRTI